MRIDVVTIFPEMVKAVFRWGVIGQALKKGKLEINPVDLRDFTTDKHRTVDGRPFGGGPGMVMRVDVIDQAIQALISKGISGAVSRVGRRVDSDAVLSRVARQRQVDDSAINLSSSLGDRPIGGLDTKMDSGLTGGQFPRKKAPKPLSVSTSFGKRVILLSPQGEVFSQAKARELAKFDHLILISGRYEGVDERVRQYLVDEELSIGEYVLSGGEIPAMVVIDAVARLVPGVIGDPESLTHESFAQKSKVRGVPSLKVMAAGDQRSKAILDWPQYTRPVEYRGWKVPEVLRSGDHKRIEEWRREQVKQKTRRRVI